MLLQSAYALAYAYIFAWKYAWPYNHWHRISPEWGLNMWLADDGTPAATLHYTGVPRSTFGVPLPENIWKT